MDQQTQKYLRYYNSQHGGRIDYFSGSRRGQFGHGLGDILRGLFRTVLPIAAHGASAFLGEMAKGHAEGKSLKESALNALAPAAHHIVDTSTTSLKRKAGLLAQQGGRRAKKRRIRRKVSHRHVKNRRRRRHPHKQHIKFRSLTPQFGGGRRRRCKHQQKRKHKHSGYKRRKTTKRKSRHAFSHPIKFLNF